MKKSKKNQEKHLHKSVFYVIIRTQHERRKNKLQKNLKKIKFFQKKC